MRRLDHRLLQASLAVPILYFGTLLLSSLLHPGYSHARQLASELGMAAAPGRIVFNAGIFLAGACAVAGGWGFLAALRRMRRPVTGTLAGLSLALLGLAFVIGALFPLPDPRHVAYGLGLAVHLSPLFLMLALRGESGYGALKAYLAASAVMMTALLVAMMGFGGLVTDDNLGLAQRLYALAAFPWIGVAGYALQRRIPVASAPAIPLATVQPA